MESLTYIFLIVAFMQCSNARKQNSQNIMNFGDDGLFGDVKAADGPVGVNGETHDCKLCLDGVKKLEKIAKLPNALKLVETYFSNLCPLFNVASHRKLCITAATTNIQLTLKHLKTKTPMFICFKINHFCKPTLEDTDVSVPGFDSLYKSFGNGTILVQHQIIGQTTGLFNGTWKDYKSAFGSQDPSDPVFWIGLDRLHRLTSIGTWKLVVAMKYKNGTGASGYGYSIWYDFKVDSESNKYAAHLGGDIFQHNIKSGFWRELIEDGLAAKEDGGRWSGRKFATKDSDHNGCAKQTGGGWWFDDCALECLNCPLPDVGVEWSYGPVEVLMAIQKV